MGTIPFVNGGPFVKRGPESNGQAGSNQTRQTRHRNHCNHEQVNVGAILRCQATRRGRGARRICRAIHRTQRGLGGVGGRWHLAVGVTTGPTGIVPGFASVQVYAYAKGSNRKTGSWWWWNRRHHTTWKQGQKWGWLGEHSGGTQERRCSARWSTGDPQARRRGGPNLRGQHKRQGTPQDAVGPYLSTEPDASATGPDATGPEGDARQAGQADPAPPGKGRRADNNEVHLSQANIAQTSTAMKNAIPNC